MKLPLRVDRDPRPGMEWNIEIDDADGLSICFMTHDGKRDPDGTCPTTEKRVKTILLAVNHFDEMREMLEKSVKVEDDFVRESGVPIVDAVSEQINKARALLTRLDQLAPSGEEKA